MGYTFGEKIVYYYTKRIRNLWLLFLIIILFVLSLLSCYTYSSTGESCQACLGSGRCNYCSGTGYTREDGKCSRCNGTGKCTYCGGTGRLVRGVWPIN